MTMTSGRSILLTGATGLLGRQVLARLLADDPLLHVYVLVRDLARWSVASVALEDDRRVVPVQGDLRVPELGLAPNDRALLCRTLSAIVHLAADTTFSNSLDRAREVNTTGTRRVLELGGECASAIHVAHVSTAFVAGRRTGVIAEDPSGGSDGWVNAYEQSKYEAEQLVRADAASWVIFRPSTIVCDGIDGRVTQVNAVHRALRLLYGGLVAMMPGVAGSAIDVVTTAYVADAIARLALSESAHGRTVHLCAGEGALPLVELLDLTYKRWARDPDWRRRGIARPALAELATYALFEKTVEDVADASLKRITRALSHFVPQLALPKRFVTTNADTLLGHRAPAVHEFWPAMLDRMVSARVDALARSAA
jgi:thioester reductase-like protein